MLGISPQHRSLLQDTCSACPSFPRMGESFEIRSGNHRRALVDLEFLNRGMARQDFFEGLEVFYGSLEYRIVQMEGPERLGVCHQVAEICHQDWRIAQPDVDETRKVASHDSEQLAPAEGMQTIEEVSLEADAADGLVPRKHPQEERNIIVPQQTFAVSVGE